MTTAVLPTIRYNNIIFCVFYHGHTTPCQLSDGVCVHYCVFVDGSAQFVKLKPLIRPNPPTDPADCPRLLLFADRISEGGNAIASVRPSVRLFPLCFPTRLTVDLELLHVSRS